VTGHGAAARHGLGLSSLPPGASSQTQPSHPHAPPEKHRLNQGVAVPLPQSPSVPSESLALNMSKWQPISPANATILHTTPRDPLHAPVPASKSAGSPSVPRRLKSPARPRLPPSPSMHVPGCRVLSTCNPLATSWLLLPRPTTHDPKPHPKFSVYFWMKGPGKEGCKTPCKCENQLGTTYRCLLADLEDRGMEGISIL
jgi:hypothetical protein